MLVFIYQSKNLSKNHCSRWLQLCVKLLPTFIRIFVKNHFLFPFQVTNNFCVSNHISHCSLEKCNFHILLIGTSFAHILQLLGSFHFTYQIINCLYTLHKYRFYSNVISLTGEVFNQLDRAVHHNLK